MEVNSNKYHERIGTFFFDNPLPVIEKTLWSFFSSWLYHSANLPPTGEDLRDKTLFYELLKELLNDLSDIYTECTPVTVIKQ